MINYVIASSKDWFVNHPKSDEYKKLNVFEINTKNELNLAFLERINPRYIFFPHWNWKVDSEIYEKFECVVFHTAPLPYGRGGSPIQNLILRGFNKSPVSALRMTNIIDGGPIYTSIEISLDGPAHEIYKRLSFCVEQLILLICKNNPVPREQSGKPITFRRLSYPDNELLSSYSIRELYDRIRMVDGSDYQKAYINFGNFKIEFSKSSVINGELHASIRLFNNDN